MRCTRLFLILGTIVLGASTVHGQKPPAAADDPFGAPTAQSAPKPVAPPAADPFGASERQAQLDAAALKAGTRLELSLAVSDQKQFPPLDPKLQKTIRFAVENLADRGKIADTAEADLIKIGSDVVPQLLEAAKDKDAAFLARVDRILEKITPPHTNRIVDGQGRPIAGAKVVLLGAGNDTTFESDRFGDIALAVKGQAVFMVISHPDYGRYFTAQQVPWQQSIVMPAINKNNPDYEKSLRGVVQTADGKPVAAARVGIRKLIVNKKVVGIVGVPGSMLTDEHGQFAYYYASQHYSGAFKLQTVAEGAWYVVLVEPMIQSDLFPLVYAYQNTGVLKMTIPSAPKDYSLAVERLDGKLDSQFYDVSGSQRIYMRYQPITSGLPDNAPLDFIDISRRVTKDKAKSA